MKYILYINTIDGKEYKFEVDKNQLKEVKKQTQESKTLVIDDIMFIVSSICCLQFRMIRQ